MSLHYGLKINIDIFVSAPMQNFSSPVVSNKTTAVESDSFSIQEVNEAEIMLYY